MGTQAERQEFLNKMSNNGQLKQISLRRLDNIDISKKSNSKEERKPVRKEKYVAKNRKIKNIAKQHKKTNAMKKRIGLLVAAGLVAFGSYGAKQYYDQNMKPVTLEEALKSGKTLEELGLNEATVEKLSEVEESLKNVENLSKDEILHVGEEIEDIKFSVIQSKLGNEIGDYESIVVKPRDNNAISRIIVTSDDEEKIFIEGDHYGKDIGDHIENIRTIQVANTEFENDKIDREETVKTYENALEQTERFASSEITVNESGKIKCERTTKADLEKIKENESKELASIEDEGR